jgi:hypothetical protein
MRRRPASDAYWRRWPSPPGRPQPMNRRNFLLGSLVLVPAVAALDGVLGLAAWYATQRVLVGLVVWAALFTIMSLELGLVAWAAKFKQDQEAARAEEAPRE